MKILMIDDDAEFLSSIQKILDLYGFDSDIAFSGSEAIKKLTSSNYDLVISDVMMPMMNGFEVLERVKNTINSEIPVILVTGEKITAETVIKAINLGVADFIQKPFFDYQLVKSIIKQQVRLERADQHKNSHLYVSDMQTKYDFSPLDFININIPDLIISQYIKFISPSTRNELLMCLEEMISNAFIHGTFNIGKQYKNWSGEEYNQQVSKFLLDPVISDRIVSVVVSLNKSADKILISVTDQGKGFDFKKFIITQPKELAKERQVDTHEIFRGLSLIQILANKTSFLQDGRMIEIEMQKLNS